MGTFEDEVVLLRRCRLALAGASLPLALGAAFACLPGAGSASALALGIALAWLGLGALLYVIARNPAPHETMARVYACGAGLLLPGRFVPAERIRGGWIEPRAAAPPIVHVRTEGGGEVALVVRDVDRGRRLLAALGVDASRLVATFWALARPLGEPRTFTRVGALAGIALAVGMLAGRESAAAAALAVVAPTACICAGWGPRASSPGPRCSPSSRSTAASSWRSRAVAGSRSARRESTSVTTPSGPRWWNGCGRRGARASTLRPSRCRRPSCAAWANEARARATG